jgi:hypothetical protein
VPGSAFVGGFSLIESFFAQIALIGGNLVQNAVIIRKRPPSGRF